MRIIAERHIAVRGFINDKYNTPFGKGLFRRAIYNGSVELANPSQKYLIDLMDFAHWQHLARTDNQIDIYRRIEAMDAANEDGLLLSWLLHYEPLTKAKTTVDGYCIYLPSTQELHIDINDPAHDTVAAWTLQVKPCKAQGSNKPVFIATNVDLSSLQAA
jgi:hypothetical protein